MTDDLAEPTTIPDGGFETVPEPIVETPEPEPIAEPVAEPAIVSDLLPETVAEIQAAASEDAADEGEYPALLDGARNHLNPEPGDHSIPERRKAGNSDVYEMTGNTLYFDAGGARLA